jgi:hypothetical protein
VSPWLIGVASDAVGLKLPVLITGCLLSLSGLVLLLGRHTLVRDLAAMGAAPGTAAPPMGGHP